MVTMSTPFKDPKSGVYKLRKAIPEELRPFFLNGKTGKPQREYWQTLDTKDLKEAKRLFPDVLADCERKLEAARAQLEGRAYSLSDRQSRALAGEWLKRELENTPNIPDDTDIDTVLTVYPDMIEEGNLGGWAHRADEIIDTNKLPILPDSDSYKKLCKALGQADVKFWHLMHMREKGDWRHHGLDRYPTVEKQQSGLKLMELYERFALEDKPAVRRADDFKTNIDRFIKIHGDLPIGRITSEHVREWKDAMVAEGGKKPVTINSRLSNFTTLLGFAEMNRLITENPATGIRVLGDKRSSNPRQSFSKDDLMALFNGPVHANRERPLGGKGEASYWLPLISLYSGARLAEIAQLTRSDVGEADGVPFFSINRDDGKKTKNHNSIRKVPLHDHLIRTGFLDYVKGMEGVLFPGLEESASGQIAKTWGQWFGRYKKERGITGKKDFHSFRHTFIDACREAGIDSELRKKITGHAPQDVGSGYGTSDVLKRLKTEIDKVDYAGPSMKLNLTATIEIHDEVARGAHP